MRKIIARRVVGLLCFLNALVFCPRTGTAQQPPPAPIIAVFSLQAKGVPLEAEARERLSEYLAARLAATDAYQVVPRDAVKKRLLTQKTESYRDCYDSACQIELGKELAAQKSLATQVLKITADKCVVTATLYDLKKAASERGATAEGGCSVEALMGSINNVVGQLAQKNSATKSPLEAPDSPPAGTGDRPPPSGVKIGTGGKVRTLPVDFDAKNFDALGFLPRAQELARDDMADAVLVDFDAEGVYPDGRVDLTLSPDFRANYRFRSPTRSLRDPKLPATVEQEVECLVNVEVSAASIEVQRLTSHDGCREKPRPAWGCTLKQAFQNVVQQGAPGGGAVAKVSWLWDGWFFDFGQDVFSVPDQCD